MVEELGVPVLRPKFLQCFCICTHLCNLGMHTGGLTPFHPPLDTTTLAIALDGVQRVCQILRHGEEIFQNLILCLFILPRNLFRCVRSFNGGFNRVGLGLGFAFRGLRFALRFGLGFGMKFGLRFGLRSGLRFGLRFGLGFKIGT